MTVIPGAARNLPAIARLLFMRQRHRPLLRGSATLAVCAVLVLTAAACSSSKDNSDDPLVVGGENETVVMTDNEFNPGNLQVPVGAQVTFRNDGDAVHNAVADGFDWYTDELGDGDSHLVGFHEPKESNYKCTLHPTMRGKITVVEP
jgi:plastocyanin